MTDVTQIMVPFQAGSRDFSFVQNVEKGSGTNVPSNFFLTAARTRYCSEQEIFTPPDDCVAL
jgi:hypothetical protein